MRVNAEVKAATRQRILEAARKLFTTKGFAAATTREIAEAAGTASGTLFNYFATKEAILAALAAKTLTGADVSSNQGAPQVESFEEALFSFVAGGLRKLKPLRKHLPVLFETALSPLAEAPGDDAQWLRLAQLETVMRLARTHQLGELAPLALQLYWTLYTGVLMFWANDRSPRQEVTLALLDDSMAMFAGWLQRKGVPAQKGELDS